MLPPSQQFGSLPGSVYSRTNRQAQRESCSDGRFRFRFIHTQTHAFTHPHHISLTHWFFNEIWFTIRAASPCCQCREEQMTTVTEKRQRRGGVEVREGKREGEAKVLLRWGDVWRGVGDTLKVTAGDHGKHIQMSWLSSGREKVWWMKPTTSSLQSDICPPSTKS